ncbi:hypothetical protein BE20_01335 [Sorangium cellulosum]|uniref:Uncharacterized protein n=1 Tax=Sorangium cellulosum TaxID=56 RepID=A0A150RG50_SORCE|nr:hypothetical protein BE18_46855 [Sorangium cellulosum]KYF93126.1 hypothetical protein BE20_01335 [Sorangium cellulosum]
MAKEAAMAIMLVAYDVHRSDEKRANVLEFIKQHEHTQVSESCYLIDTDRPIEDIHDQLLYAGGGGQDYAVIGPISDPLAIMVYSRTPGSHEWLRSRLPLGG